MREFIHQRGDESFHGAELETVHRHILNMNKGHFSLWKGILLTTWLSIPSISSMEKKRMAHRGEMGSWVTASG